MVSKVTTDLISLFHKKKHVVRKDPSLTFTTQHHEEVWQIVIRFDMFSLLYLLFWNHTKRFVAINLLQNVSLKALRISTTKDIKILRNEKPNVVLIFNSFQQYFIKIQRSLQFTFIQWHIWRKELKEISETIQNWMFYPNIDGVSVTYLIPCPKDGQPGAEEHIHNTFVTH